jgi:hypothetical protein
MPDFIPRSDQRLLDWSANFRSAVVQEPQRYGLDELHSAEYSRLHDVMDAAMSLAIQPASRTTVVIALKDEARAELVRYARELAAIVRATKRVTGADRIALGLTAPKEKPVKIAPPSERPQINAEATGPRTIRVRLGREITNRFAKPEGVNGAAIYIRLDDEAGDSESNFTFYGNQSRCEFDLHIVGEVSWGQSVWLCARWFNPRGQLGPVSKPFNVRILGGVDLLSYAQRSAA